MPKSPDLTLPKKIPTPTIAPGVANPAVKVSSLDARIAAVKAGKVSPPTQGPRTYAPEYQPPKTGPMIQRGPDDQVLSNTPPGPYDAQPDPTQLKNWDKTTGLERLLYNALPGASDRMKALAAWDERYLKGTALSGITQNKSVQGGLIAGGLGFALAGPVGGAAFGALGAVGSTEWGAKLLGPLDWMAEQAERIGGLASQVYQARNDPAQMEEIKQNLKEAYYAGGLTYDVSNLTLEFTPQAGTDVSYLPGIQPLFTISTPGDLPGQMGLVAARKRIIELTDAGVPLDVALTTAREELYADLGALAIRAQVQDLGGHIFIDPLNLLFGAIKPVERVFAKKFFAVAARTTPEDMATIVKAAEAAAEVVSKADDELRLANESGDVARIAEAAAKAEDAATTLKNARLTQENAAAKLMSRAEQFVVWASGETFGEQPGKLLGAVPAKWNPFSLTSESRAAEYEHLMMENINTRIMPIMGGGVRPDPESVAGNFMRAADGAYHPQLGSLPVTKEGRAVIGLLRKLTPVFEGHLKDWRTVTDERVLLDFVARVTGETDAVRIAHQIQAGDATGVWARFTEKLPQFADEAKQLQDVFAAKGLPPLTEEGLAARGLMFKNADHLLDSRVWVAEVMGDVAKAAMTDGLARFGVKSRGLITAMADAAKSAETLAFLRLNPSYPLRNYVNNFVTGLARGSLGLSTRAEIAAFRELTGFNPIRLREGIGAAGEMSAKSLDNLTELIASGKLSPGSAGRMAAMEMLADAREYKGVGSDLINKFTRTMREVKLGKADMGGLAQHFEGVSRESMTVTGYARGMDMFGRSGKLIPTLASVEPGLAASLDPALVKILEHGTESVYLRDDLLDNFVNGILGGDKQAHITFPAVRSAAEQALGRDISLSMSAEQVKMIEIVLNRALPNGKGAVRDAFHAIIRPQIEKNIDDLMLKEFDVALDEAKAFATAGKGDALTTLTGDAVDDMSAAIGGHSLEMSDFKVSQMKPDVARAFWQGKKAEDANYYRRTWDLIDKKMAGLAAGAKDAGLTNRADEVVGLVKDWRRGWDKFNASRTALWDSYFEALHAGKTPAMKSEDIHFQVDSEYETLLKTEDLMLRDVDHLTAQMLPEGAQRDLYLLTRDRIAKLRMADKVEYAAALKQLRNLPDADKEAAFVKAWTQRNNNAAEIYFEGKIGKRAMAGDPQALSLYESAAQKVKPTVAPVEAATPPVAKAGETVISDTVFKPVVGQRIRSASGNTEGVVVDILPSGKFKIKMDDGQTVIRQGKNWTTIAAKAGEAAVSAATAAPVNAPALPDFFAVIKKEMMQGQGMNELYHTRISGALSAMEEAAVKLVDSPPPDLSGLTPEQVGQIRNWAENVKGGFGDARYASTRFAEWTADSALLNYNRRYNYNNWLGTFLPYEFWMTQSAFKWALHSIDRPGMITTYLRMKKFLDTAYKEEPGLPSRLRGMLRISTPFLPDFMGDEIFVDPFRMALPFDSWSSPFEAMQNQESKEEGVATRKLYDMLKAGDITQEEMDNALMSRAGPVWDRAIVAGRKDDTERRLNWQDFALMLSQPHVPLMWAYNVAMDRYNAAEKGIEPQNALQAAQPGALLPMTTTIGKLAGMFGLDPAGPYNPEAAIRKAIGLHPFNKWDEYYTGRMLANMAATGQITDKEATLALIDKSGPAWDAAAKQAAYESGGGPIGFLLGLSGLPVKAYPPGEEYLRNLKDEYAQAWRDYEASGGDYKATVGKWLETHPGYETRLSLFKKPEEQMRAFVTDEFWNAWNNTPTLTQNQLRDALGPEFEKFMADKDYRLAVPSATIGMWLKLMGGDPPGTLTINPNAPPLTLAPPDIAARAQVFYDTRDEMFPDIQPVLDRYFSIDPKANVAVAPPKWVNDFIAEREQRFAGIDALLAQYDNIVSSKDRAKFKRENSLIGEYNDWVSWNRRQNDGFSRYFTSAEEYKGSAMDARDALTAVDPRATQYLDWRREWLLQNPDVVPYLVEDPAKRPQYESAAAYDQAQANQPGFTFQEWRQVLGWPLMNLVADHQRGEDLPPVARQQLDKLAKQYGFDGTAEEFAAMIAQSQP